jgi:hypothetical protein
MLNTPVASIATWVTPNSDSHPGGLAQHPVEGLEGTLMRGPALRPVAGDPDHDRDLVLADIARGAPLVQNPMHAFQKEKDRR